VIRGLAGSPVADVTFAGCKITSKKGLTVVQGQNIDQSGLVVDLPAAAP
jgi:hypothetical protein